MGDTIKTVLRGNNQDANDKGKGYTIEGDNNNSIPNYTIKWGP